MSDSDNAFMPMTRFGFITILGFPNAGKSTLLNRIVGSKISIVTPKPQTTRFRVLGVRMMEESQLVFLDTPGIFKPKKTLDKAMVDAAWKGLVETDCVVLVIDATRPWHAFLDSLLERLKDENKPLFVALNKIDEISKPNLLTWAEALSEKGIQDIFMISAKTGEGVQDLLETLRKNIPLGPWHYSEDHLTDLSERLWAAEITREALFLKLDQELPYGLMVETTGWEKFDRGDLKITQTIYVERAAHRAIIIGHQGSMIKQVRQKSQHELQASFGHPVHLFLHVKIDEKWAERRHHYQAQGLDFPG